MKKHTREVIKNTAEISGRVYADKVGDVFYSFYDPEKERAAAWYFDMKLLCLSKILHRQVYIIFPEIFGPGFNPGVFDPQKIIILDEKELSMKYPSLVPLFDMEYDNIFILHLDDDHEIYVRDETIS